MSASPTSVLVVGATGGMGRRVVAAAQGHGLATLPSIGAEPAVVQEDLADLAH